MQLSLAEGIVLGDHPDGVHRARDQRVVRRPQAESQGLVTAEDVKVVGHVDVVGPVLDDVERLLLNISFIKQTVQTISHKEFVKKS